LVLLTASLYGLGPGLLVAGLDVGIASIRTTRHKFHRAYSIAAAVISLTLAFSLVRFWFPYFGNISQGGFLSFRQLLPPLAFLTISHFLMQTGLIAGAVAYLENENVWGCWRRGFWWVSLSYLVAGSMAALLYELIGLLGLAALFCCAPILGLLYFMHHLSLKSFQAQERHLAQLEAALGETSAARRDWELTFEAMTDGLIIFDQDRVVTRANSQALRMLELDLASIAGRSCCAVFRHINNEWCLLHQDFGAGRTGEVQLETRTEAGRDLLVSVSLFQPTAEAHEILVVMHDITERKRAEEAVRESQKRYRDLVENSQGLILICTHDLEGVLLSINPAAAHLLGYEPAEMIGRDMSDFVAPGAQREFNLYLKRIHERPTDSGLLRVITRDGEERTWTYRNSRYQGTALYVMLHAQDITDRMRAEAALRRAHDELELRVQERTGDLAVANEALQTEIAERNRAEEALRRSEEHFRSRIENASDLITVLEPDGTIRYESPSVERVLGYQPEEMVGKNAFDYIHPDDLEDVANVPVARAALPP
jgi:PAS domain S-box-containing protein